MAMVVSERVYIGGIEPPRLTVEEVMRRLETTLKEKIEIRNHHDGGFYTQFDAIPLEEQENVSGALEMITKIFNNVTWKGCKLKVRSARPHLLERLAEERRQRSERVSSNVTVQTEEQLPAIPAIPRHLKVKRRYGQESLKVDTKPFKVSEWEQFQKMAIRQQKRREKEGAAHKAHSNRAVHLRFVSPEDPAIKHDISMSSLLVEDNEDTTVTSNDGTSSSYASSQNNVRLNEASPQQLKDRYVWSDDSSSEERSIKESRNEKEENDSAAGADNFPVSSESEQEEKDTDEQHSLQSAEKTDGYDLRDDVENNLDILAQLFPDSMRDTQPHTLSEKSGAKNANQTSGLLSGRMIRFDPTKESAQQFILCTDKVKDYHEEGQKNIDEKDCFDKEDERSLVNENTGTNSTINIDRKIENFGKSDVITVMDKGDVANDHLYEQVKLEEVFREAREGEHHAQSDVKTQGEVKDVFSFAFDVPSKTEKDEESQKSKSTFAFSFATPKKDSPLNQNDISTNDESDTEEALQIRGYGDTRRERLYIDEDELDACIREFYKMHYGERIINDPEGYRNDPKVKEDWERERKILTNDWKRKRKYALSRKKKKMR